MHKVFAALCAVIGFILLGPAPVAAQQVIMFEFQSGLSTTETAFRQDLPSWTEQDLTRGLDEARRALALKAIEKLMTPDNRLEGVSKLDMVLALGLHEQIGDDPRWNKMSVSELRFRIGSMASERGVRWLGRVGAADLLEGGKATKAKPKAKRR